jgi:excisionase family DNA binding protein
MSRLSLTDWYRYLETQYADDQPEPQSSDAASRGVVAGIASDAPTVCGAAAARCALTEISPHPISEPMPASPAPMQERGYALVSIRVPHIVEFVPLLQQELNWQPPAPPAQTTPTPQPPTPSAPPSDGPRLRKRKGRKKVAPETIVPPEADALWAKLPQYLRYLAEWTDDGVTRKYYPVRGRDESREELIARLTDPVLTLEETARLLGVCPATVRRYTDRGWLRCFRTEGNQRRFRLSDIVAFLEEQALRQPRGNRNARRESETP